MHRSRVVFPDPEGPMRTRTSPRATVTFTSLKTCARPNHVWTPSTSTTRFVVPTGTVPRTSRIGLSELAIKRSPAFAQCRPTPPRGTAAAGASRSCTGDNGRRFQREPPAPAAFRRADDIQSSLDHLLDPAPDAHQREVVERNAEVSLESTESRRLRVLGDSEQLLHADHAQQRRDLQHVIEVVSKRRHDYPSRLRQDDPPHHHSSRHADRERGLLLPLINGEDAGPDNLTHVRALVYRKRNDPGDDCSIDVHQT